MSKKNQSKVNTVNETTNEFAPQTQDTNIVDEMLETAATAPVAPAPKPFAPPPGYENAGGDVKGYYNPTTAINFTPDYVVAIDNNQDKDKVSLLVIGTLIDATQLDSSDDGPLSVEAEKGDLVGVWYKAGMSALKNCAGVPTYMYPDGQKETGKAKPMKVFRIFKTGKGRPLLVREDKRKLSKHVDLKFGNLGEGEGERPSFPSDDDDAL